MDDQPLEKLIRMAMEADELASGALGGARPNLVPVAGRHLRVQPICGTGFQPVSSSVAGRHLRVRRIAVAAATLAVAAALVVLVVPWRDFRESPQILPRPTVPTAIVAATNADLPAIRVPAYAPADESCVVMAVFQTRDGKCQCRAWQPHASFGGRNLAQVDPAELIDYALNSSCGAALERLLVVAVSGRAEDVPDELHEAESLFECLESVPPAPGLYSHDFASAASPCVREGVTLLANSVTWAPR